MIVINLDSYTLEEFDYNNKEHMMCTSKFDFDSDIREYLITTSDSFCELVDYYKLDDSKDIYNKLYLVKKEDTIIGSIEFDGKKDDLYLNYSVLKEYRNKGHAKRLLIETSKYLLDKIKKISVLVKKENIASINTVNAAGYRYINDSEYGYNKYVLN